MSFLILKTHLGKYANYLLDYIFSHPNISIFPSSSLFSFIFSLPLLSPHSLLPYLLFFPSFSPLLFSENWIRPAKSALFIFFKPQIESTLLVVHEQWDRLSKTENVLRKICCLVFTQVLNWILG